MIEVELLFEEIDYLIQDHQVMYQIILICLHDVLLKMKIYYQMNNLIHIEENLFLQKEELMVLVPKIYQKLQ
jgi:hypothetical protein